MIPRAALVPLRLPRVTGAIVRSDDHNNAMQQLEQADTQNVKMGTTPNLPAVILTASDGSSWRLVVNPDGSLHTSAVTR